LVSEPATKRHLGRRRAREQQAASPGNPEVGLERVRREPDLIVEPAHQLEPAEPRHIGELAQQDSPIPSLAQVCEWVIHLSQVGWGCACGRP